MVTEPVTAASPSGSVTAATSEARAPPEMSAVRWSEAPTTVFMPLKSITIPLHKARPAQSWLPPRTNSGTSHSRAARMADCACSGVRQWTTARGMRRTGFGQIAVAAAYRSLPGRYAARELAAEAAERSFDQIGHVLLLLVCSGNSTVPAPERRFGEKRATVREDSCCLDARSGG